MSVILGSEIARLVLGYLQDEHLDEAATAFCKTSPYLVEEYEWLQRGYRACKISDSCLVNLLRENCEIKYAFAERIKSLPLSMCETLQNQNSLSGKIDLIFDLLTNPTGSNSVSRKRPYPMNGSSSTQSTDLPGYEPTFKERRLSRNFILRPDVTPKQNSVRTSPLQQNTQEEYASDNQNEEKSTEQANSLDNSRNETSQYPIFTETILENTQFQNVLAENINRILESSSNRIDMSVMDSGEHEATSDNNALQDQMKEAIDNIILSTEQDPTFEQVLDEVVRHTAIQEQPRPTSTEETNNSEKIDSPVPLKQRLRNRHQDKPRPNYNETVESSKKKRKPKIEVISNEIVSGDIRDILHPTVTVRDNYVPLNQILCRNSGISTTTSDQNRVYINVPTFQVDGSAPMFLQDNGPSTSLMPGSIINLPTINQQFEPIQSLLPNVIVKDILEVNKAKPIERSNKKTPTISKNLVRAKDRNFSTTSRQPHVRSLNFACDDVNESGKPTNIRNENDRKFEITSQSSQTAQICSEVFSNNSNQKTIMQQVEQQQDSSEVVVFCKEPTVIPVELSPVTATKSNCSKEGKRDVASEKCQKPITATEDRKKSKSRKTSAKSNEVNVSTESVDNATIDIEARMLEKALQSVKKSNPFVATNTTESTKETNNQRELKASLSPTASAKKSEAKNPSSAKKCSSSVPKSSIQIKLPAFSKKKPTMSKTPVKRASPAKQQKTPEETKQIDPSQTIDIDLISPIERPKELNNAVKSGVNLDNFLDTPCKDSSPLKFPITPGHTKTPSSQKGDRSYNRATKYSFESSCYKLDESVHLDKSVDVLIKKNPTRMMAGGLGVDRQQNMNFSNDQEASDGELSDSSTSSESESESSSSATSSSADESRSKVLAQRMPQQLKLEEIRLRTTATIKSDKKIEIFSKPKTEIDSLHRPKVIQRPVQQLKMTGNSTPKIGPKVCAKLPNKPNPKRKITTSKRVICADKKDHMKTSLVPNEEKQGGKLPAQSKKNATVHILKPQVCESRPVRSATPTETIDAIENHIAKTSHNSFDEGAAKSTRESLVDTPNLLEQLQGKSEVIDATTPEMDPPASSMQRVTLARELFGDATMSDSDFMDTPVKVANDRLTHQLNVVPILLADLKDSNESKNETDSNKSNDSKKSEVSSDSNKSKDSEPKESKNCKDINNFKDSRTNELKTHESTAKTTVGDSNTTVYDSKKTDVNESIDKKVILMDSIAKDSIVKDSHAHTSAKSSAIDDKSAKKPTVVTGESYSESDDDDDYDEYDECTLIPSLPKSNLSNRIYSNVISETEECAIRSNTQSLDLRPLTTFLDGRKIVVITCDEINLYSSAPMADSMQSTPNDTKSSVNKRKRSARENVKQRSVEQKISYDGTVNSPPSVRFNIVAKLKGPLDVSSSSWDQRKISKPEEQQQENIRNKPRELRTSIELTRIPSLLKDMDINKVLGKIHPSKEVL